MIWILVGLVAYALFVSALLVCACLRAGAAEYERILAEEKLARVYKELREVVALCGRGQEALCARGQGSGGGSLRSRGAAAPLVAKRSLPHREVRDEQGRI